MSTNSIIAIKNTEGKVKSIYCHWDGYIAHNGRILNDHYITPSKINELMDLGDISSLHPNINSPEGFSEKNHTIAYMRDRGEKNTEAQTFNSLDKFEKIKKNQAPYAYLFDEDSMNWLCYSKYHAQYNGFLSEVLEKWFSE